MPVYGPIRSMKLVLGHYSGLRCDQLSIQSTQGLACPMCDVRLVVTFSWGSAYFRVATLACLSIFRGNIL